MASFPLISRSLARKAQNPVRIRFPAERWDSGPIFDWYSQADTLKQIRMLQIFVDSSGPVPHRFIIAHMTNGDRNLESIYRLDRRPDAAPTTVMSAIVLDNGTGIAKDEYIINVDASSFEHAQCEVELSFDPPVDLAAIIKACYGITRHESARNYSLLQYNCFFFSWTILMVVARHHRPYELPTSEEILSRFTTHIPRLTNSITEEFMRLSAEYVIDAVTILRARDNTALLAGFGPLERLLWAVPTDLLRIACLVFPKPQFHLGLRAQLKNTLAAGLVKRGETLYATTRSKDRTTEIINNHLWLEQVETVVRPGVERGVAEVLWDGILEVIEELLGEEPPEQSESEQTLKFSVFGVKTAQLLAVWDAAIPAGLKAAREAVRSRPQDVDLLDNNKMFDLMWFAARDGAKAAARGLVDRTRWQIPDKRRHDLLWRAIWNMWDECWQAAHLQVRTKGIAVLERIVLDLVNTGVGLMIESMQHSKSTTMQVRVFFSVSVVNIHTVPFSTSLVYQGARTTSATIFS
ncbi:hypothetical protein BDV93DRAFT_461802 [Ceratobasidium sp. AG-I]|nr:hypothetical protein BDV93DRAFT_461802 [Ceratobasidium sp. AG-I]